MTGFSTLAIILRRTDLGDFDLILHCFTLESGKISVIAKSAKKSVKRFSGLLEPFCVLSILCTKGRGRGLPVLQEASMEEPFAGIRTDIKKTAYASYWAEMIDRWVEEKENQTGLFHLFRHVLGGLDRGGSPESLSILFQMRFLRLSGHSPNLRSCLSCHKKLEEIGAGRIAFDLRGGGLVCADCPSGHGRRIHLSKGTIKQCLWMEEGDLTRAARVRFTPGALAEGLSFLEQFVSFHLEIRLQSLAFLGQIRNGQMG